jgi:prepilin-type N-terminal cleavage/methylation domain-containing protein
VSTRRAFSLVELLVVTAVIAIIAMLSLPAIQSARETARRVTCRDNLRHLALAVLEHESAVRRLPPATQVTEAANPATCTGCWNPWLEAGHSGAAPGPRHGTSWMLTILPFLEQTSLHGRWDMATNVLGNGAVAQGDVKGFYCPTRRSRIRVDRHDHRSLLVPAWRGGGTDYGGCYGRLDGFVNDTASDRRFADVDTPIAGSSGRRDGLFAPNEGRRLALATDGLSRTMLLGELQRLRPLPGATAAANTYNRTSQDGWAVGGAATLFVTATDPVHGNPGGMNNLFFESPGSDHGGGAFFAMADGAVHWLSEFIDAKDNNAVFPLLGSMRDARP